MKKIILSSLFLLFFAFPVFAQRGVVTEWYIKDFQTELIVNDDSSITVTERIMADCGNLPGKHGIFRILPKYANTPKGKIKYPIKLLSITDSEGQTRKYSVQEGLSTLTWKIGDSNIEVQGENYYEIKYLIKNAIRKQEDFDEFYWNLSGNYWDMEIDNFRAEVVFPEAINRNNTELSIYSGLVGDKNSLGVGYEWLDKNILSINLTDKIQKGEGVTLSVAFPQGIIIPYKPSIFDYLRKEYLWLFLPIAIFILCFSIWRKYGYDPRIKKPVIAEYEAPGGLSPIEMSMLASEGGLDNRVITASIIRMAVLGILKINEIESKVLMIPYKDFELVNVKGADLSQLSESEKVIYDALFIGREKIKLSKLKNSFYKSLPNIKKKAKEFLFTNNYMESTGLKIRGFMIAIGIVILIIGFQMIAVMIFTLSVALIISGFIVLVFAVIMPKKTEAGAMLAHQVKGFKDYIKTAEKHRALFYEKENIFEKILPYAIMFNMAGLWIKKMREIYGEEYFQTYIPAWYVGSSVNTFNIDSFTSLMDGISTSISSSVSSSSGHAGGGFSGGGGGGGGGGGW